MVNIYSSPGWAGYWISPTGKAFRVETSHINDVLGQCEKFGLPRTTLEHLRRAGQHETALTGGAEKTVLDSLFHKGWIAVHHYPGQGWTVQLHELSTEARQRLGAFFEALGCASDTREPVRIETRRGPLVVRMVQVTADAPQPRAKTSWGPLMFVDNAQSIPDDEVVSVPL